jgi:hypothetical protein
VIEERLICVEQIDEVVEKRRSEPNLQTVRAYSSRKRSPSWSLIRRGNKEFWCGREIPMSVKHVLVAMRAKIEQHIAFNGQDIAKGTPVAQILFYPPKHGI